MSQDNHNSNKTGKVKFISANLYQIHPKTEAIEPPKPRRSSAVLKAGEFETKPGQLPLVRVRDYSPSEVYGKKHLSVNSASNIAIDSMKQNLKTLNQLQARLRFVLKELEELVKE